MSIYEIKNRGERNYECTNVIAARSDRHPGDNWKRVSREHGRALLTNLTRLYTQGDVTYYGYL